MSPLWPESIYVGLFPGHCWLQRAGLAEHSFIIPEFFEPAALLLGLEKMLDEQSRPVRKGSRLALTISDSIASITTLPWQEELRRPAELDSYARICFDKLGIALGEDWVLHTEFRHYGGMGLAYAVPRAWLETLVEIIRARGLRLISALPLSAAAYSRQRFDGPGAPALLLLQERNRSSALIFNNKGLAGYDVEPYARSAQDTRMRLLNRVGSGHEKISQVACWSYDRSESDPSINLIPKSLTDAKLFHLKRNAWN